MIFKAILHIQRTFNHFVTKLESNCFKYTAKPNTSISLTPENRPLHSWPVSKKYYIMSGNRNEGNQLVRRKILKHVSTFRGQFVNCTRQVVNCRALFDLLSDTRLSCAQSKRWVHGIKRETEVERTMRNCAPNLLPCSFFPVCPAGRKKYGSSL